jgi:cytochrome c556
MKSLIWTVALLILACSSPLSAKSLPAHPIQPATAATPSLKQYMATFGTMLAGLEIIKVQEKNIDWEVVDLSVREMSQTLDAMQKADSQNRYREYTDILAAGMIELKEKSAKKDKGFFKALDKVSESCFKCHAAHRPGDYLIPKDQQYSIEKRKP